MDDLISRQAAVEAIVKARDEQAKAQEYGWEWEYNGFNHAIQALPMPTAGREWLHEYLQTAVDFGIITETQASRLMDMIDTSEDNT